MAVRKYGPRLQLGRSERGALELGLLCSRQGIGHRAEMRKGKEKGKKSFFFSEFNFQIHLKVLYKFSFDFR